MILLALSALAAPSSSMVDVRLDRVPKEALTCAISNAGGDTVTVSWDAAGGQPLVHRVFLADATTAKVSCGEQGPATTLLVGTANVTVSPHPREAPALVRRRFSARSLTAGGSFRASLASPVPDVVADTLTILAEIAQQRFREGLVQVVADQAEDVVCVELSAEDLEEALQVPGLPTEGSLLPATCRTLTDAVFLDLVNDPTPLFRAVESDAVDLGFGLLAGQVRLQLRRAWFAGREPKAWKPWKELTAVSPYEDVAVEVLEILGEAAGEAVRARAVPDDHWLTDVVVELGHGPWEQAVVPTAKAPWKPADLAGANLALCTLDVAFAAATLCAEATNCNPDTLADLLLAGDAPSDWFLDIDASGSCQAGGVAKLDSKALRALRRTARDFVGATEDLRQGRSTPEARRDLALQLAFDVAERVLSELPGVPAETTASLHALVEHTQAMTFAVVQHEIRTVLTEGAAILERALELPVGTQGEKPADTAAGRVITRAIGRTAPVISVLASNAELLAQARARPEQAEALAAARKQAVEDLLRSNTQRGRRGGDWIASVGADPSFVWGSAEFTKDTYTSVPLRLPIGLAVEYVPNPDAVALRGERACYFRRTFGWRAQLSPLDATRYLPDTPDPAPFLWSDILVVDARTGPTWGRPGATLGVSAFVRWAPYAGADENALTYGAALGYYVPFFDLN